MYMVASFNLKYFITYNFIHFTSVYDQTKRLLLNNNRKKKSLHFILFSQVG